MRGDRHHRQRVERDLRGVNTIAEIDNHMLAI
jgi:hypothetical protein